MFNKIKKKNTKSTEAWMKISQGMWEHIQRFF